MSSKNFYERDYEKSLVAREDKPEDLSFETNLGNEKLHRLQQLLDQKKKLAYELPHLYGKKFYKWQHEFFHSINKMKFLVAANQIGKSSIAIRQCVHWATEPTMWNKLWPDKRPNLFWYLYPTRDVINMEFKKKWSEWLPRGDAKDSYKYGWSIKQQHGTVASIEFNNGISVLFKTYAQNVQHLQSGTVFAMWADEELPVEIFDELMLRLAATNGYYSNVFTATLGQELWYRAIECRGTQMETFPKALKIQVSMYDCLQYMDGSETPWTKARIREIEERCGNKAQKLRRVYGRFIKDSGKMFHAFDPIDHVINPFPIPDNYLKFVGVDVGSGGEKGHPSAIVFIATNPEISKGYIYKCWRGDGIETTSADVISHYNRLVGDEVPIIRIVDSSAIDFYLLSQRKGLGFQQANKTNKRNQGIDLVNTLFQNGMLKVLKGGENEKIIFELTNLSVVSNAKSKKGDDLADALRYITFSMPWDLSKITEEEIHESKKKKILSQKEWEIDQLNRGRSLPEKQPVFQTWETEFNEEIAEFNELLLN